MKTTSKMKVSSKLKTTSKIDLPTEIISPPPPLKKLPDIFSMTSHLDSHTTTDVIPDMLSGVQTGNGIYMIDIIYAALPMCAQTEKTTFSCKDD